MTRFRLVAGLAALAVVASASAAFAAPNAVSGDDFDLRKDPRNRAARVNYVDEGDLLTITECRKGWCFAKVSGPDGWIRQDLLIPVGRRGEVLYGEPFELDDEDDFVIDPRPGKPGRPGQGGGERARACFYEDENFGGQSFCVRAGEKLANVGWQWNDTITSVRVYGRAEVEVCEDENFGGACVAFDGNVPNIGWQWNDQITSLSVF